jgi:lysozyme
MRFIEQQLIRHEGLRLRPYRCPAGKLTIGVGRNLDDVGISKAEAMDMLHSDIEAARDSLSALLDMFGIRPWHINRPRQDALCNVCFNIGGRSLSGFRRMWSVIQAEDWDTAAAELLDSRYAKEVGARAIELAEQIKFGKYGGA